MIDPISRRSLVLSVAVSSLVPASAFAATENESQSGDPGGKPEILGFDEEKIRALLDMTRAVFLPKQEKFSELLIAESATWIGKSRHSHPEAVARLLELFNLPFSNSDGPVPFCAAGLSFAAASVYAKLGTKVGETLTLAALSGYTGEVDRYHFYPTPSVNSMRLSAQAKNSWTDANSVAGRSPRRGWLVLFDWSGQGQNHVGLIEKVSRANLQTIEFNTTPEGVTGSQSQGGSVARRNRKFPSQHIKGFIRL